MRGGIAVLGAGGMLGHKVLQRLRPMVTDTIGLMRGRLADLGPRAESFGQARIIEGFDASDPETVRERLRDLRPRVIVNCIGIIKQRASSSDAIGSIMVNALLPHVLADVCSEWQGRLIHISTDCVFTGFRGGYLESDPTDATDLYGRTKALGEPSAPNSLTLRTSMIGRELANYHSLLEWFLGNAHGAIRGFRHAIFSGVTTNHLASLIAQIISDHAALVGTYHVASTPISKYELLMMLRDAYGLSAEITPDDVFRCDRSLNGEKLMSAIGYRPPSWSDMIAELVADETPYGRWR